MLLIARRCLCAALAAAACSPRLAAHAATELDGSRFGYIDNAGMKSYSSVQKAWESSKGKSQSEIMMAARGAGKRDATAEPESDKSRKRRAMAGCHDDAYRQSAGLSSEAECNSRVLGGDVQFMIDVIDK